MPAPAEPQYRAHFDARIEFANGGGLTADAFRLDLPRPDADEAEIARLLIQHLGLALVGSVTITNLTIVEEQHRGSRGIAARPAASGRRVVDLSHRIREGLITYPGLPAPVFTPHLTREASRERYAPGTEFALDIITMIGNTGTYLDSPYHRYEGGTDLAGLELATLVDLPAEVFHLTDGAPGGDGERRIGPEVLYDRDLRGAAVLLHTGWDARFGTPAYASGSPYLSTEGVAYLIDQGVALVGIDCLNIDDTESGGERPAHTGLLAAGIHVVEHMTNLGELPPSGARFTAAPPAVEGFGTFPVRAFAIVEDVA
ncbi:MAG: cyclase family protein [Pseudolysinimonas sp.]